MCPESEDKTDAKPLSCLKTMKEIKNTTNINTNEYEIKDIKNTEREITTGKENENDNDNSSQTEFHSFD